MKRTENWLALPTVFLSSLSIASCLGVCIIYALDNLVGYTIKRKNRYASSQQSDTNKDMSLQIIFYLCVCDGLWSVELLLNWFLQIDVGLDIVYWTESQCMILGIYSQFFGCLSPLWHVLLAYHLCYLLFGGTLHTLRNKRYYHYITIILLASIATIIPLFPHNEYGTYTNPDLPDHIKDRECWLKSNDYQLIYVGITTFSMLVHYFTLIVGLYKWKHASFMVLSPIYHHICVNMLRFVFCYTLIRLPATIARSVEIATGKSYWGLLLVNHWMQSVVGMGDFIVYLYNRKEKYSGKNYDYMEYKRMIRGDSSSTFNQELKDSAKFITPIHRKGQIIRTGDSALPININASITTLSSGLLNSDIT